MKKTHMFYSLLFAAVLLIGCNDQTSPDMSLNPSDEGTERLSKRKAEIINDIPFSFPSFNPCTGLVHQLSGTIDLSHQFFFLKDGTAHHENVFVKFTIETDDGYSGFANQKVNDDGGVPGAPDEEYSHSSVVNINLSNDEGGRIKEHFALRAVFRNGEFKQFVYSEPGAKCVGVPDN